MRRLAAVGTLVASLALNACAQAPLAQPLRGDLAHTTRVAGAALAYCARLPLEEWTDDVRHVIVAVHGLERNACGMRRAVVAGLGAEGEDTVVVAPLFASRVDAPAGGHVWGEMVWPAGATSSAGASSYEVLDDLVASFGDRRVSLVGFSGGAQFTNRYAAVSPVTLHSYLVLNPSTYLWFSPDRPGPTASCPEYDHWRYGLAHRDGYAARLSAREVQEQYAARTVRYLVGSADDDPRSGSLDRTCAAMAQGDDREERALNYHRHLLDHLGVGTGIQHRVVVVPGVGHDAAGMLTSPEGRAALLWGTA